MALTKKITSGIAVMDSPLVNENVPTSGDDVLWGYSSNDRIDGLAGNDIIEGEGGDDELFGSAGDDKLFGGDGLDTLHGGLNNDLLEGGAGNDTLYGHSGNDILYGDEGDDLLDGGSGADLMTGGDGGDTYYVDNVNDQVVELGINGLWWDTVNSSVSWTLGQGVERLNLTGSANIDGNGNAGNNTLSGNDGNNRLYGGAGDDRLRGGNGLNDGADHLYGGDGSDVYSLYAGDTVEETNLTLTGGIDTVRSHVDGYVLGAGLENLELDENLHGSGNELDNMIVGSSGNEVLDGAGGNDRLYGGSGNDVLNGGSGADIMMGGWGHDVYYVDNQADVTREWDDSLGDLNYIGGNDAVLSWVNHTLAARIETLILQDTTNLTGTGNALNNTILGNSGNNVIDGGLGGDAMNGGDGNDTYYVDNAADTTQENTDLASGGIDTVYSSTTFHYIGHGIENLTLTGTAYIGGGNFGNNTITGNNSDNFLDGGHGNDVLKGGLGNDELFGGEGDDTLDGGVGADGLYGGSGNDSYIVDNAGDMVQEGSGAGVDLVKASINYTLTDEVEYLSLTSTEAINGSGNSLNNVLTGNNANNILDGGDGHDSLNGSLGADTMIGGLGNDSYSVDNSGDVVIENIGGGTYDLVSSLISYALGANIENLRLTGIAATNGTGNELNNVLTGNTANNVLRGLSGIDTLNGMDGNDTLDGGDANDVLIGGNGKDLLTGGNGADRFDFNTLLESQFGANRDVIYDFSHLQGDRIDLSPLDANSGMAGDQAFSFIGNAAFNAAGQVRYDASSGIIQCNVDGNLGADFEIGMVGVSQLVTADFFV